ncbi:MAG TPA: sulfatase [Mycobacteriales bacterium]|nr:sulfatase [Mycobacteriales bacterium]
MHGWASRIPVRLVAVLATLTTGIALLGACTRADHAREERALDARPNIVFVLTDDMSSNLFTPEYMPHTWALMHDGAHFSHYYVTDSLCCPSRSSIFTGRYPHDTGIFTNSGDDGGYREFQKRREEDSTFATDLHAVGYRTAMMGKYLNLYDADLDPPAHGWDEWDVAGNSGYLEFNYRLNQDGKVHAYAGPNDGGRDNYMTDVLGRLANSWVSKSSVRSKPFLLEVATFAPHAPFVPAPRDRHLFPHTRLPKTAAFNAATTDPPSWLRGMPVLDRGRLRSMAGTFRQRAQDVHGVDDMIGSLVDTLKSNGEWDNTYFVFSSDNGYHIGEHRLSGGKLTAFDTDINVPLVIVGPHIRAGTTVDRLAENIDLRPTFDDWAGTRPQQAIDGRTLTPLLAPTAGAEIAGWPRSVLVEHHGPDLDPLPPTDPDHVIESDPNSSNPPSYEAMRTDDGLYVEYLDGEREYYDTDSDPYEIDNIWSRLRPALQRQLHVELTRLEACTNQPDCDSSALIVGARPSLAPAPRSPSAAPSPGRHRHPQGAPSSPSARA